MVNVLPFSLHGQHTYSINREPSHKLRPDDSQHPGVNTVIWTSSKTLAVIVGAFVGTWASHLAGAPPIAAVIFGLVSALVIFLLIRKR